LLRRPAVFVDGFVVDTDDEDEDEDGEEDEDAGYEGDDEKAL
jgi:hypothetical protein